MFVTPGHHLPEDPVHEFVELGDGIYVLLFMLTVTKMLPVICMPEFVLQHIDSLEHSNEEVPLILAEKKIHGLLLL